MSLRKVRSLDGTSIAYETFGAGPPLVLIHGALSDRTYWAPVGPGLAERFTVVTVDRRGRGASGDTASYAIDREFEDVAAVVAAIDEPVYLLGHSYGGICALEAALRTRNLAALALYEPAVGLNGQGGIPASFIERLDALIAAGERDQASELMMREIVGLPGETLAALRADATAWQPMVDCVHTLPRELRGANEFTFDAARYRALEVPTVLLAGTDSPAELRMGVELVRAAVDGARVVTMRGVDHEAVTTGPEVLTATLLEVLISVES